MPAKDADAKPLYVELYDHQSDPRETVNVAKAHPEVVSSLTRELNRTLER